MKLVLMTDVDYLNSLLKRASDLFVELESDCLNDVDIDRCLSDYIKATFIFNNNIFKVVEVED